MTAIVSNKSCVIEYVAIRWMEYRVIASVKSPGYLSVWKCLCLDVYLIDNLFEQSVTIIDCGFNMDSACDRISRVISHSIHAKLISNYSW